MLPFIATSLCFATAAIGGQDEALSLARQVSEGMKGNAPIRGSFVLTIEYDKDWHANKLRELQGTAPFPNPQIRMATPTEEVSAQWMIGQGREYFIVKSAKDRWSSFYRAPDCCLQQIDRKSYELTDGVRPMVESVGDFYFYFAGMSLEKLLGEADQSQLALQVEPGQRVLQVKKGVKRYHITVGMNDAKISRCVQYLNDVRLVELEIAKYAEGLSNRRFPTVATKTLFDYKAGTKVWTRSLRASEVTFPSVSEIQAEMAKEELAAGVLIGNTLNQAAEAGARCKVEDVLAGRLTFALPIKSNQSPQSLSDSAQGGIEAWHYAAGVACVSIAVFVAWRLARKN